MNRPSLSLAAARLSATTTTADHRGTARPWGRDALVVNEQAAEQRYDHQQQ